jgi:DNA-binding transcriptional LysR family regulator
MTIFDDLALLRAFVGIVESGSISAGARRLKIPQPTLSRYLRTMEDRCGTALLRRDTHQMSLTETGHRLLADARTILDLTDEADRRLRADQTTLSGHLRIFATIDGGQSYVTQLITKFLQSNTRVTAELAFTNRPLRLIQEGCDVAIVAGQLTDENVVARPAGSIVQYLAASPVLGKSRPNAKTPADLHSWPWIELSGYQFREQNRITFLGPNRIERTLSIAPIFTSEGVTSIREAVLGGLGVALLPDWLIRDDIRSGRLVRILPHWRVEDLPLHVAYAAQRVLPVRVRSFADFAVAHLSKLLRPEGGKE